jgi:hypothetical protein
MEKILQNVDKNYSNVQFIMPKSTLNTSLTIILHNDEIDSDESDEIKLITSTELFDDNIPMNESNFDLYFMFSSKYFKQLISNISSFSEVFTIEKIDNMPLSIRYKTQNQSVESAIHYNDDRRINLRSNLDANNIFSVSTKISYVSALSGCLLTPEINIYASNADDILFIMNVDSGVFNVKIKTSIIRK